MINELYISPPNSLLLILDPSFGAIPESIDGLIASTESCIAVGTLSAQDGETRAILTDEGAPPSDLTLAFEGEIETPSRRVAICNVHDETLVTIEKTAIRSRVRIYVNDDREPDYIHVLVTEPA
ncbi:MAG: hypothetical protein GC159_06425 [Phycisphaera sp.]|nr:hypothetical protein [Phycisphaera sp.]